VDACGGKSERTEAAAFRQIEAVGGVTTLATALAPDFYSARQRHLRPKPGPRQFQLAEWCLGAF